MTLALLALALAGCSARPQPGAAPPGGYQTWSAAELKQQMSHKAFTLVNVHIPFEGRIAGTDLEIPYDQILAQRSQLPADKSARIVLYCSSGRMSEIAAKALAAEGYTGVVDVQGGMQAWKAAGNPLQTK